jgi:hypothetical protein
VQRQRQQRRLQLLVQAVQQQQLQAQHTLPGPGCSGWPHSGQPLQLLLLLTLPQGHPRDLLQGLVQLQLQLLLLPLLLLLAQCWLSPLLHRGLRQSMLLPQVLHVYQQQTPGKVREQQVYCCRHHRHCLLPCLLLQLTAWLGCVPLAPLLPPVLPAPASVPQSRQ